MIIIGGATASGKTDFAAKLAKLLNSELISADSMQVYYGMDIGTAKVKDETLGVKQNCIDIVYPKDNFSVFDYRNTAENIITNLIEKNKIPIVVGGTGFYISSLIYEFSYGFNVLNYDLRAELEKKLLTDGIEPLFFELKALDPESAEKISINNTRRIIRALEITKSTGIQFSKQNPQRKKIRDYDMYVLCSPNRDERNNKIDSRVDKMIEDGLCNEVENLLNSGVHFDTQSMQGIGYKEWKGYFNENANLNSVIELIKINTKHYAKRQETWFKHQYENVKSIQINELDSCIANIFENATRKFS
ncbi:MAG: tRNA (adenosine(37)-N6)-dimethylallyltransferase MiaA [Christensenellaceae bacterium]|nr:tRNA (adenosine(37)-N6)-dimethylallyltransferase MiaA [Christensenellaceae bacterium]